MPPRGAFGFAKRCLELSEGGFANQTRLVMLEPKSILGDTTIMKFKLGMVLLITGFLYPTIIRAQVPVGRWEIVHTSGDNVAQASQYPGSFSTFLSAGGTGYTYGTFTSSMCVIDTESYNVVPTWVSLGSNNYEITITVDNLGLGPNFSFVYIGQYNSNTNVPGDTSYSIPAITGTYYPVGDASACSVATQGTPGTFVATLLPTLSSGSALGSLDGYSAANGSAFDSTVNATLTFSTPAEPGQISGTVALASNPTFTSLACFATTGTVVNALTINPNRSSQSGVYEYVFAEGLDPYGVPTTLFLDGFSADLYTTASNTDLSATQVTSTEWAVSAAIGEDYPAVGITGVSNDGTNNAMVYLYGVIGGVCNGAGGVDAPFHFISGTPIDHKPNKHHRRGHGENPHRGQLEERED
jgi:hypothetical protein